MQFRLPLRRALAKLRVQPRAREGQILLLTAAFMFPNLLSMPERRRMAVLLEAALAELVLLELKMMSALGEILLARFEVGAKGGVRNAVEGVRYCALIDWSGGLFLELFNLPLQFVFALLEFVLAFAEPQPAGTQVGFELTGPGVDGGFAAIDLAQSFAKVSGEL